MASNKDILEAQRFNRRRLVTAFSSGTPRGRDLESCSSLCSMIVGAVLVVVMVAAAGIGSGPGLLMIYRQGPFLWQHIYL